MAFGSWNRILFIDQKTTNTTPIQYIRTFRLFEFESNSSVFVNKTDKMSYDSMMIDTKEAIAYFSESVLFKENESIIYCDLGSYIPGTFRINNFYPKVSHL